MKKLRSILIVFILLLSFVILSTPIVEVYADGEAWLTGWDYRKSHEIANATGAGTDYQIMITVYNGSDSDSGSSVYIDNKTKTDFGDIRFTDNDGDTLLDYWMEEKTDETSAKFWIEVADDLSSSNATIYAYYGNDAVSTTSNGANTFLLFDHFLGDTLNATLWNSAVSPTVANSKVEVKGLQEEIYSVTLYGIGTAIRGYGKLDDLYTSFGSATVGYNNFLQDADTVSIYSYAKVPTPGGLYARSQVGGSASVNATGSTESSDYKIFNVMRTSTSKNQYEVDELGVVEITTNIPLGSYPVNIWTRYLPDIAEFDWILVRKYVYPEPANGDWGAEEALPINQAPENVSLTIPDMDDTDNLYAQIVGGYTVAYTGSDDDGWEDIDYILLNITQGATVRVCIKYTNSSDTFSIEVGSAWVSLGSSSSSRSGVWLNLTVAIDVKFGAGDEADLELKAVIVDSDPENDTDTMQTDYCDVISDLAVSNFAINDARGNTEASLVVSGDVTYSGSALYPPDAEFTHVRVLDEDDNIKGTDSTIVNGAFSVGFVGESLVKNQTYNPWIDMVDADYVDAEEGVYVWYISDRILITDVSNNDSRVDVDAYTTLYSTAELEFDSTTVGGGVGDNLTINGLNMTWDGGNTKWYYEDTKASVQNVTYDTSTGYEATYGVSVINQNGNETWVVWDRIKILTLSVNASRIDIDTYVEISATAELEFDSHALGSGDNLTINGVLLSWDAGDSQFEGTDTKSSVQQVVYDTFTTGMEATYEITVGNMDGKSDSCIWDRIVVYYQELDDSRVDLDVNIEFRAKGVLDWDEHALGAADSLTGNLGALSWDAGNSWFDGSKSESTVTDYTFLVSSGNEVTYDISVIYINVSDPKGVWDRVDIDTFSVDDTRIDVDTSAVFTVAGIYEYDSTAWSGTYGLNDTISKSNVDIFGYRVSSITDSNYGLTGFQQSAGNLSVIFDRIIILTFIGDPTANITAGSYSKLNATAELEYDSHPLASADTLTIEGLPLDWDGDENEFIGYETMAAAGSKTYDEGVGNEATYGITVVNMDGLSVTVTWSAAVGWLFDMITPVVITAVFGIPAAVGLYFVRRRGRR